jgi:predicted nucleotidyltransferase component of viral defense system
MGQTILTPHQSQFLELVGQEPDLVKDYYFTGGTALTEYYLKHRISEDIDLFTQESEVDLSTIEAFLKKISSKLGVEAISKSQYLGLFNYYLHFKDDTNLKVDFNYYPFPRIETGKIDKGLQIDSLYDIAANKIQTIFTRPRSRDFIDLYFIYQKQSFDLKKLLIATKTKFDWPVDPLGLASQFLRAGEFGDEPTMVLPYDKKDMIIFFQDLSYKLKDNIFQE